MNGKSKWATAVVLAVVCGAHAQGYIVPSGVTSESVLGHNVIKVRQNPANSDYTGFSLDLQSGSSFLFNPLLDEGVRTFLVEFNDPISLQSIQSAGYIELTYPNTYNFTVGNPFYVGLYTGDGFPQGGVYPNPMYGWAQLVNNGGVIQLLGGELAYGAGGIYAGTTTLIPVPEPTTLSLFGLGLLALGWYARRRGRE